MINAHGLKIYKLMARHGFAMTIPACECEASAVSPSMSYVTMAHSGKLIMATNSAAPLAHQIPSPSAKQDQEEDRMRPQSEERHH